MLTFTFLSHPIEWVSYPIVNVYYQVFYFIVNNFTDRLTDGRTDKRQKTGNQKSLFEFSAQVS